MNLAFDFEVQKSSSSETLSLNSQEKTIHEKALEKSRIFKKAHAELLNAIIDVDASRLFEKFLLNSTFSYCTKVLGLSEDVTCTLTRLARISAIVPELKMAIDEGSLNMSNARHIAAIITPESKTEWLEKAKTLPQKKLQHEVAKSFPQQAVQEKAKFVSEERVKLEMGLDIKVMDAFRRAQDLVSQKFKVAASLEITQEELLKFYLERNDPLLRAKRAMEEKQALKSKKALKRKLETKNAINNEASVQSKEVPETSTKVSVAIRGAQQKTSLKADQSQQKISSVVQSRTFLKRKSIPADIVHQVNLRDLHQCQAKLPNNSVCANTRWLEHHHKIPVQHGGQDTVENLITLCSFHHRQHHKLEIMKFLP